MSEGPLSPRNRLGGSSRLWSITPLDPRDFACEIMGEPVGRPKVDDLLLMPAELWVERPEHDRAGPEPLFADEDEDVELVTELEVLEGPDAEERTLLEGMIEEVGRDAEELLLHSLRVGALTEAIARELGLGDESATLLRRAAVLHDCGKLVVPEEILLKPGCLQPEELEVSRMHPSAGAHLLDTGVSTPVLRLARVMALGHHERWNGTGYPSALAGEANPFPARVVAVADVFDALPHERPYTAAWSVEDAASELARQRGNMHEARIIDALFRVLARAGVIVPELRLGEAA